MHLHANGIDQSKLREKYNVTNPSICKKPNTDERLSV